MFTPSTEMSMWLITPRACTRGNLKVIGLVLVVVIISTKITISRCLGTYMYSVYM